MHQTQVGIGQVHQTPVRGATDTGRNWAGASDTGKRCVRHRNWAGASLTQELGRCITHTGRNSIRHK